MCATYGTIFYNVRGMLGSLAHMWSMLVAVGTFRVHFGIVGYVWVHVGHMLSQLGVFNVFRCMYVMLVHFG